MPTKKRSIDIVQPKYHPSAKPDEAAAALSKDDVMMLLEKSKRSKTTLPDGSAAPNPTGGQPPAGSAAPKSGRRWASIILGAIALIAAAWFGVQAGSRIFDTWADLTPVQPDEVTSENSEPIVETPAANAPAATTPVVETPVVETPVAAPVATPVTVKVLNGNGTPGDAGKVQAILEAAGITVAATGNAKTFGYASTIVYYPAGKKEAADRVAAALTSYTVTVTEDPVADGYDALVVVGAK